MATEDAPLFSVVVPTYERPETLKGCLEALAALGYPRYEVVVVDDGSSIAAARRIAEVASRYDRVTLVRQANAGPAAARNAGAQQAAGAYLAFTDDDCRPAPVLLRALATRLGRSPEALVGGRTVNALRGNLFAEASQTLTSFVSEEGDGGQFFASCNIALPREAFLALGGFDDRFPQAAGEDRAFCRQWHAHGGQSVYAPEAIVWHAHVLTFRSFLRQQFNYGRGAHRFHEQSGSLPEVEARPGRGGGLPHPVSFYTRLVLHPLWASRRGWGERAALALLMLASQAAVAAGLAAEAVSP